MNCQKITAVLTEVARDRMMDAAARQRALAHAAQCAPCAAHLENERVLTAMLNALAAEDQSHAAPLERETTLLAAFARQTAAAATITKTQTTAQMTAPPTLQTTLQTPAPRPLRWWRIAAALFVVALATLALTMWRSPSQGVTAPLNAGYATTEKLEPPTANIPGSGAEAPAVRQGAQPDLSQPTSPSPPAAEQKIVPPVRRRERRDTSTMAGLHLAQNRASDRQTANRAGSRETTDSEEIVTGFIPLTPGYTLEMNEGGQLVRVELPRATLSSFGLPVNTSRLNEPVTADVVLGNDGIARAIRFVR